MAKQPAKKNAKKKPRKGRPWPRNRRVDEFGVRLTSDSRPFPILTSDFASAMREPANLPVIEQPSEIQTRIPELRVMPLSNYGYAVVLETITAMDDVQELRMNPTGGPNLRFRIELAAVALFSAMEHACSAVEAQGGDTDKTVNLTLNLVVRRAQEIWGQGGA